MKNKLSALLLFTLCSVVATPAFAEIKAGIMNESYPPYFTKDAAGKWTGYEVELFEAVCKEMNETCSFVDTAWDALIPALQSKKFDVIWSGMGITEERTKIISFTDPYYQTGTALIGAKDGHKGATAEDVKGKIIGIQVATVQSKYFARYFADVATEQTYPTLDGAFQDLAYGRVDYVMGDTAPLLEYLKSADGQSCCEDKGEVAYDPAILGLGVAGGLRKDDDALRIKLNAAIAAIKKNGVYDTITQKYFGKTQAQ
ncbi:transporter substrate-binding domain-containing protein [Bartonella sp. LJL80]